MNAINEYLDPTACPEERPSMDSMSESTRALHRDIDDNARRLGAPCLHPEDRTIQLDLLGSERMAQWQEGKVAFLFEGEGCWSELPQVYARYGTEPTLSLLQALKALEGAHSAVAVDCGMQAVALLTDVLMSAGDHAVVMRQVYNKSAKYIQYTAERLGGSVTIVEDGDLSALGAAIHEKTKMVFAETFTNPLMRAQDPRALGETIAKSEARPALVLDTTIATPWAFQAPALSFPGVAFVVGAGTKALAGQDRDLFGYIASNDAERMNQVMDLMAMRGGILDWRRAEAIVSDLALAKENHLKRCRAAVRIASFLDRHPRVESVYHPSLPSHPDRSAIDACYHGDRLGSLLSFSVTEEAQARKLSDAIATCVAIRYALSFDGLVSKVNHHRTVSEYFTPEAALKTARIDRLVRIGVGLEASDDLIACLNWALHHGQHLPEEALASWRTERLAQLSGSAKPTSPST